MFCLLASVHLKSFHRPIKHVLFSFWIPATVLIIRFHLCSWNFCVFINTSVKLNVVVFFLVILILIGFLLKCNAAPIWLCQFKTMFDIFVHLSRFFSSSNAIFLEQQIFSGKKCLSSQNKLTISCHQNNAVNNDCLDMLSRNCFFLFNLSMWVGVNPADIMMSNHLLCRWKKI